MFYSKIPCYLQGSDSPLFLISMLFTGFGRQISMLFPRFIQKFTCYLQSSLKKFPCYFHDLRHLSENLQDIGHNLHVLSPKFTCYFQAEQEHVKVQKSYKFSFTVSFR